MLNATVGADLITLRSGHGQKHGETEQVGWLAPAYCMQLYLRMLIGIFSHLQTLQVPIQAIGGEGSGVGRSCNPMRSVFPMFPFLHFPSPAFILLVLRFSFSYQQHIRFHCNTNAIVRANGRYLPYIHHAALLASVQ